MGNSHFFAILARMKYINRWGLMHNIREENIAEHSLEVSMLSHALVTISNERFGTRLSADRAAVMGIFHDAGEIITGDLPTPIKYYNEKIRESYQQIEKVSEHRLLGMLPKDLQEIYSPLVESEKADKDLVPYVKAADKLSAYIKCANEISMGNKEFVKAQRAIKEAIDLMELPALKVFMEEFMPSYELTLDEIS